MTRDTGILFRGKHSQSVIPLEIDRDVVANKIGTYLIRSLFRLIQLIRRSGVEDRVSQ